MRKDFSFLVGMFALLLFFSGCGGPADAEKGISEEEEVSKELSRLRELVGRWDGYAISVTPAGFSGFPLKIEVEQQDANSISFSFDFVIGTDRDGGRVTEACIATLSYNSAGREYLLSVDSEIWLSFSEAPLEYSGSAGFTGEVNKESGSQVNKIKIAIAKREDGSSKWTFDGYDGGQKPIHKCEIEMKKPMEDD